MGTDIIGWIECRRKLIDDETWEAAINLDYVYLGRDYEAFSYLFGVRNKNKLQPVAEKRGLPADSSLQVRQDAARPEYYAHTWISWQELKTSGWQADQYWQPLMKMLEIFVGLSGEENVRLVVWFAD